MEKKTSNFSDTIKSFTNPEFFLDSIKNIPMMDMSGYGEAIKKNTEVFSAVNQLCSDSIQSIVKRSTEVMQNNATEMFSTVKDMLSVQDMEQAAATQQRYIKSTIEDAMNNTKEIMDMTSKVSAEIFEILVSNTSTNIKNNLTKKCNNTKD